MAGRGRRAGDRRRDRSRRRSGSEGESGSPPGCRTGFGVSPSRIWGRRRSWGSRRGTTEISACVYGCCGLPTTVRAGPSSTMRPRYMTTIRSAYCVAVERSCVIIRIAEPAAPQAVEQIEDAGAHRDVEHRYGLVGYEQLRLQHERCRDRDALSLAARELVRVTLEEELGGGEPGALERIVHALGALCSRPPMRWISERLAHGVPHAVARIERLVGILEDDLCRRAAPGAARARAAVRCPAPSISTEPERGTSMRMTACAVVVLPQPDSPTSATSSPAATRQGDAVDRAHDALLAAADRARRARAAAGSGRRGRDREQRGRRSYGRSPWSR